MTELITILEETINFFSLKSQAHACFLLAACLAYASTLKTEAVRSFDTSLNF
jgi:hypothetical protein